MGKSRARRSPAAAYLTPSPRELSPRPASAFEDTGVVDLSSFSPPESNVCWSTAYTHGPIMSSPPPTLTDILLNVSPPPYTLSAFMAFLSQNHCMETLEFTLDSQRYAAFYNQPSYDSRDRSCLLWERLMHTYITPGSLREVNIPSRVRDSLLSLSSRPSPPPPSALDEAGRIIFELMNDSLLVPFLQSVAPPVDTTMMSPLRTSLSPNNPSEVDSDGYASYSDESSPMDLMTPPTTPPGSEFSFSTASSGVRNAVAAHNKGWKKVGAKLGLNRRSGSRPTSGFEP